MDLSKLPSTFYRVSLKAFIFDNQGRLLLGQAEDGKWEPPGGGWEHDETIADCLSRELQEELGVKIKSLGEIMTVYRGRNKRGYETIKVAIRTEIESDDFRFGDLAAARYVSKEEIPDLEFSTDENGIKGMVDKIWPSGK